MGFFYGGVLTKSTRCVDEILLLRSRTKSLRDEILAALGLHFDSGDELGPGFSDAPAGEDSGEPGMFGSHILDVPVFARRATPWPSGIFNFECIGFRGLRPPVF